MRRVAEEDRDRRAVEVVDADDSDRRVDRVVDHLAENVDAVTGLAPVDPDVALTRPGAEPRRLQGGGGLERRLDEPSLEVALVARP